MPAEALSEAGAKRLLAEHGLPVLPEHVCTDEAQARAAQRAVGGPVVAKILSPDIAHKTEIGGVMLDIASEDEAAAAYRTLLARARERAPSARIEGVLIAPMAGPGVETVLGVHQDATFGPMMMFGLGGVALELFKDVAFASAPLTPERARGLIERVRASRLLTGWRGQPALDVDAVVQALVDLSAFAVRHAASIEGIDVNPLLVRQQGAVALDAVISVRPAAVA